MPPKKKPRSIKRGGDLLAALEAIGVFITGIFTVVLAIATIKLWNSTNRLAEGAEKSSERQLRAYVHQIDIEWHWHVEPVTGSVWYTFKPQFKNLGSTPARNVKVFTSRYLELNDIPADFPFTASVAETVFTAGPQALFIGVEVSATGNDLVLVQSGQLHFLIWGWAKYRDVFEGTPERVTKFCVRVSVRGNPLVAPTKTVPLDLSFMFHADHNEAT